jgi:hypothetical protein
MARRVTGATPQRPLEHPDLLVLRRPTRALDLVAVSD